MATNFAFNVLATAQRAIAPQDFIYREYEGRTTNEVGQWVATYLLDVAAKGSIQPVPRQMYDSLGLDKEKSYKTILTTLEVNDVSRDASNDKVVIDGVVYNCVGKTDWTAPAGWNRIVCVRGNE